jgi:SAM-dependent methyltransferase
MTKQDTFKHVAEYYDRLVERYGHDPRACDYGRPESQLRKFQVLADIADLKGKRILDVGCGFADYAEYLRSRFGLVKYVGIDVSPRMIKEAKRLRPELDLRLCNVLDQTFKETFDVVTANGLFYLLGRDAPDFLRQIVRRMCELAEFAVAFNSLSSWAPIKEPAEFYADPLDVLKFCRTLTPWVALRHDYFPHDFTIYMYKRQRNG